MVDACPLMTADALPRPYVHLNLPLYMWLIDQRQEATVESLSLAGRTRSSFFPLWMYCSGWAAI